MAMRAETAAASMVSPPVSPLANGNPAANNNNDINSTRQPPAFSLTKSSIPHDAQHNTTNADSTEADMMASLDAVLLSRKQEAAAVTSDYYSSGHGEDDSDHPLPLPQHKVLASATTSSSYGEQQRPASPLDPQTPELLLSPPPPQQQQLSEHHQEQYHHHHHQQQHTHLEVDHGYSQAERDAATPTLEQMGLENMDQLDIRMLLQSAYEVIQEKDRDLGLAAMMGQELIETNNHLTAEKSQLEATNSHLEQANNSLASTNNHLEAKYQKVLTQFRQHRAYNRPRAIPPKTILLSPAPEIPMSSNSLGGLLLGAVAEDNDDNWVDDFEPSQHRSMPHSPLSSSLLPSPSMSGGAHHVRRTVSHSGGFNMRSRSRQDIEKLATLENLNTELQMKVEAVTKELKQGRRQAFKRYRKAEQELQNVKNELERSTSKALDLEEQNGRLIEASRMIRMRRIQLKNQLPAPGSIPGSTMASIAVEMQGDDMTIQEMLAEDNRIFEELRDRLKSLERMNLSLVQQKVEADKKTAQIAQDLSDMQKDHEDLMTNLCQLSNIQSDYDKQAAHVRELENTIQEHQNTISTMSSRLSQLNSPLMSPSEPSSPMQSLWRRDDADFKALKTILHGSTPQPMVLKSPNLRGQPTAPKRPRRTLLAELESEWFRDLSFFGPPRVAADQQEQQQIHLPGIHAPKSPKVLKNHRHDSESEFFSDDTGGRVKGWRQRIRNIDMEEESACESSNCIRKKHHRRGRFQPVGTDTDAGGMTTESHGGEDSDVERYQLYRRRQENHQLRKRRHHGGSRSGSDDDEDLSDCSDPMHHSHHHGNHHHSSGDDLRTLSPDGDCCCYLYDEYSSDYTYDDEDEEESVVGWAHFEDYDASSFGYDQRRDGYYLGRRSRRGIFGMVQSVFMLFRLVWRWCRFISILSTALAIAVYRGPDALLTDR
ncbi:hypothetical protein BGZ95_000174 [Linnemannia exigua]|uniref:Uncharacterized protein n=1 Tax=Linnemannia exigua TaxID=604196 RepID=A0AAD4H4Z1_9FUNG|nr:hypothetical protein BGZ95_000174 [Linnemannia exigua]